MNCTRPSPGYGGYSGYGGYGWLGGQTRTEKTKCYMRSMFSVAAVGWRDTAGRNRRLQQVLHEARSCKGLTSSSIGLQQKHEKETKLRRGIHAYLKNCIKRGKAKMAKRGKG